LNREASVRRFVEGILNNPPSEAYVEALTRAALSTPANAAAIMMADLYFLGPTDLRPLLDALDRPVLFVFSSLDWAVAAANEIREGWPEVPVKVMDGASHALFVDKPQEFNSVLKEFLASLPK
jgi:pimeloyl-ACP methyl ester carboxylesterase